ncbi:PilW family protein [Pseudomonas sp. EA_35y_Pfl2_R5]|uniref:PilW family protein n=1 Tax=Pseudomonas sp. EA_35y_Pfl2_R5 TaxID=3088690 RepID=UPI0030D86FFE
MNSIKKQIGLSMIELLIALAISSFLILGITQIFVDNKRNYVFQQMQASNLESGRFAALMLNDYLGKAGYRRSPSELLETAFPQRPEDGDCLQFTAGSAITGLKTDTGFCIRYQPVINGELDCQGEANSTFDDSKAFIPPPVTSMIVLAIKYLPGDSNKLHEGSLRCKSLNATAPQYVELIKGVASLRLDFGVGKTDLLEKQVSTFIPQKDWTATSGAIRSVRYQMLLASRENQRDSDDSKILTDWLENSTAAEQTIINTNDKKRIYQVAGNTQTLRNLMP